MSKRTRSKSSRNGPGVRLPLGFEQAFEHALNTRPEPEWWPRSVRAGGDYALRVCWNDLDIETFAACCADETRRRQRDDIPGDPAPDMDALAKAERAGPAYARAFELLGQIRDGSHAWAEYGWAIPTLASHTTQILQRAARGERVRDDVLAPVLEAAQHVASELGMRLLATYSINPTHVATLNQRDRA